MEHFISSYLVTFQTAASCFDKVAEKEIKMPKQDNLIPKSRKLTAKFGITLFRGKIQNVAAKLKNL